MFLTCTWLWMTRRCRSPPSWTLRPRCHSTAPSSSPCDTPLGPLQWLQQQNTTQLPWRMEAQYMCTSVMLHLEYCVRGGLVRKVCNHIVTKINSGPSNAVVHKRGGRITLSTSRPHTLEQWPGSMSTVTEMGSMY